MTSTRRGHTLVEMMVAMTVFSSVLALAFALMQALLKLEDHATAHADTVTMTGRLARIFRSDVHRAESVELDIGSTAATGLLLRNRTTTRVRYRLDQKRVVRVEYDGDRVRSNDAFPLPMGTAWFEVTEADGYTQATLVFDRRVTRRKRGDARTLRFDAVLGKNWRYAQAGTP